jgi:hypothetical protein
MLPLIEFIAVLATTLFAGAAIYVNLCLAARWRGAADLRRDGNTPQCTRSALR